jgi:chromosomal replication initiation ATPase DnaA
MMEPITDKERADKYKQLYNSELALRKDLEAEVKYLQNQIYEQEYSTPEKVAAMHNVQLPSNLKEIQEAIDKTVKVVSETRFKPLEDALMEHVKQLYKIQVAMLGRVEAR